VSALDWFVASLMPGSRAAAQRRANAHELELMIQLSGFVASREMIAETIEMKRDGHGVKAVRSELRLK
jgi:hypothetical protein